MKPNNRTLLPLLALLGLLGSACHPTHAPAPQGPPPTAAATTPALPTAAATTPPPPAAASAQPPPSVSHGEAAPPPPPEDLTPATRAVQLPPARSRPALSPRDPRVLAMASNVRSFGSAVSAALAADPGNRTENLALCPPSVYATLNLLAQGAHGETRAEIVRALQATPNANQGVSTLFDSLRVRAPQQGFALESSSATWIAEDLSAKPEFLAEASRLERAEVHMARFSSPGARDAINAWASEKTHGLVSDLVPPGWLKPSTALALTNAVYFNATWQYRFKAEDTKELPFHPAVGQPRNVLMMRQEGNFNYRYREDAQVVEIPYSAPGFSMFIVVPYRAPLAQIEREMNKPEYFPQVAGELNRMWITLFLPRFRVSVSHELRPSLEAIGIRRMFTPEAELDLVADQAAPLSVDSIRQALVLNVTEEHTEAAAATITAPTFKSAEPEVHADHPFLFAIVHRPTWTVLFSGRVNDPG